jgi:hypothetical protein
MTTFSTCGTCNLELIIERDGQTTHDGCKPAPKTEADQLLEQFTAIVAKMAEPGYTPRQHDELNLSALQDKIDSLDNAPPALGPAALWYAEQWGWPVFPLEVKGKRPAIAKRDGGNGFKDATTDPDRIKRFWSANPHCNIGIPTGVMFDVIDIDLPDGPAQWATMRNAPGAPDIHGIARTASGGMHVLIKPTGRGNGARIRPGVDYRGDGGYIVAAPSWLGSRAHAWAWDVRPGPQIRAGT